MSISDHFRSRSTGGTIFWYECATIVWAYLILFSLVNVYSQLLKMANSRNDVSFPIQKLMAQSKSWVSPFKNWWPSRNDVSFLAFKNIMLNSLPDAIPLQPDPTGSGHPRDISTRSAASSPAAWTGQPSGWLGSKYPKHRKDGGLMMV